MAFFAIDTRSLVTRRGYTYTQSRVCRHPVDSTIVRR